MQRNCLLENARSPAKLLPVNVYSKYKKVYLKEVTRNQCHICSMEKLVHKQQIQYILNLNKIIDLYFSTVKVQNPQEENFIK